MKHLWKYTFFLGAMICCILGNTGVAASQTRAETVSPKQILIGEPVTGFGDAIAVDQDTLLIGAPRVNDYNGRVFVYVRSDNAWILQATFAPDSDSADLYFGYDVALNGNTALVGAPSQGALANEEGSTYIFVRNNGVWSLQAKLQNSTTALFGSSVELGNNTALVGGLKSGGIYAVYAYKRTGTIWRPRGRIWSSSPGDQTFGQAMSISGDTALIKADNAVEVFTYDGNLWVHQMRLTSAITTVGFGNAVALDGNTAIIGAPFTGEEGTAHIFTRTGTTWTEHTILEGEPDPSQDWEGEFGASVGISGNNIVIGAPRVNHDTGEAYLYSFDGSTWNLEATLISGNADSSIDYFARSIAMTADEVFASVWQAQKNAVHIFDVLSTQPPLSTELLVNNSFEDDSDGDFVPDGWVRKNPVGDGRRCNQTGHHAYEGLCTYLFKADPTDNNKLVQNVDLNTHDLNTGDQIKLTGFYDKQSTGSIYVRLFVSYANLPQDQASITLTQTTTGYKALPPLAITLQAKPTRVRVQLQNQTASGKTWFDALSLSLTDNSGTDSLIPLPMSNKLSTLK